MTDIRVAVIGTGAHPDASEDHSGYSMGYRHAEGYRSVEACELVGCADLEADRRDAFADHFGLSPAGAFEDHVQLLDALEPNLVSVCTPPGTHASIVGDCAPHDAVRAIHCEKPIATTWGESESIVSECDAAGVQLTFNLQNRCRPAVERARELVDEGEIGTLRRIEVHRRDLLQTGIHNIDIANYLNAGAEVEWVLGALDFENETVWYTDMYAEDQSVGLWLYDNGVHGMAVTGDRSNGVIDRQVCARGSEGDLRIGFWGESPLEIRSPGTAGWNPVDVEDGDSAQTRALRDVVEALRTGRTSRLDASHALRATEIVFGVWESARRRGRVDLPLDVDDNPLESMIETR